MASTIGIKVANGEFYSIIDEDSNVKKRLVLTTVHDGQKSVQIDLYKSVTKTMADALYIGSLVIDNLQSRPRGEPSIEMVISSNANGGISADAVDLDNSGSEHQRLSISLSSMADDLKLGDIPDFELETQEPPQGLFEKASAIRDESEKRSFPWVPVIIAAILVLLLAGAGVYYFLFYGKGGALDLSYLFRRPVPAASAVPGPVPPVPPPSPPPAQPVPTPPPPAAAVPAPPPPVQVITAPPAPVSPPAAVTRRTRQPPVASYKTPQTIPREGVPYRIRWGDTLWDISEAFYRNPWQYPRIARFNNNRNPDLIISGTTIRIPPRL
jgi:LysM repeat protein